MRVWRSDSRAVTSCLAPIRAMTKSSFSRRLEKRGGPVRFRRVDDFFRTYRSKPAYTILLGAELRLRPREKWSRPQIPLKCYIFRHRRHPKRLADGLVPAIIDDAFCRTVQSCMSGIPSLDAIFRNPTLQRAESGSRSRYRSGDTLFSKSFLSPLTKVPASAYPRTFHVDSGRIRPRRKC